MIPAAAMGVSLPPRVPWRWFRHAILLAVFLLLLYYFCAWSLREWPHLLWEEPKNPGPWDLSPLLEPSPGTHSGCQSGVQSCISEGPPLLQVCLGQGWDQELQAGP